MKKIKINSREFYVIDGCSRENYTLCVAAEAWGKMQWAENGTPNVLDVANCNNPDSILYTWYEGVPEEIRKGMLLVSVTTADKCEKGYVQNLYGVRTFIPSYDEWKTVPQEIRKKIGVEFIWTRTLAAVDHIPQHLKATLGLFDSELFVVGYNCDTGRVIAAVFQSLKSVKQYGCCLLASYEANYSAHKNYSFRMIYLVMLNGIIPFYAPLCNKARPPIRPGGLSIL